MHCLNVLTVISAVHFQYANDSIDDNLQVSIFRDLLANLSSKLVSTMYGLVISTSEFVSIAHSEVPLHLTMCRSTMVSDICCLLGTRIVECRNL